MDSKVTSVVVCLFLVLCFSYIPSHASAQDTIDPHEYLTVTDIVYWDMTIGGYDSGRIEFGLFGDLVPRTVANFKDLSNHTHGYGYRGSNCHRIIAWFMAQCGDITHGNGWGTISIYGGNFDDEYLGVNHTGGGWLGMANAGPNTNGAQVYITTELTAWLDGQHVIFGVVLSGMSVVYEMEFTEKIWDDCWWDKPHKRVAVKDSGILPLDEPFRVKREPVSGDGAVRYPLEDNSIEIVEDNLNNEIEELERELEEKIAILDQKVAELERRVDEEYPLSAPAPSDNWVEQGPAHAPAGRD